MISRYIRYLSRVTTVCRHGESTRAVGARSICNVTRDCAQAQACRAMQTTSTHHSPVQEQLRVRHCKVASSRRLRGRQRTLFRHVFTALVCGLKTTHISQSGCAARELGIFKLIHPRQSEFGPGHSPGCRVLGTLVSPGGSPARLQAHANVQIAKRGTATQDLHPIK